MESGIYAGTQFVHKFAKHCALRTRGAYLGEVCQPGCPASCAEIVTAAMLVIGDEILSGRTKDKNIGHLADIMTAIGIDLKEVRMVRTTRTRSPLP
jgi:hypothetical protein